MANNAARVEAEARLAAEQESGARVKAAVEARVAKGWDPLLASLDIGTTGGDITDADLKIHHANEFHGTNGQALGLNSRISLVALPQIAVTVATSTPTQMEWAIKTATTRRYIPSSNGEGEVAIVTTLIVPEIKEP